MAALDVSLANALEGRGSLCVLTGEPGTGKSRLISELSHHAIAMGFQNLEGNCLERDRDFPFAPFVDALRQCLISSPTVVPSLQRCGLAAILPELSDRSGTRVPDPLLAPEQTKRRLFESMAVFLAERSTAQPLLLVIEDVHWADPTSLELLEILPRRLSRRPVVIAVTARRDEANSDLLTCLASLRRSRAVVEISVEVLDEPGVIHMVKALLGKPVSLAVISNIHMRTDGNPFYVEELISSIPPGADPEWLLTEPVVPISVQKRSQQQIQGLTAMEQRIVDLAAISGNQVDFDLLLEASGTPIGQLLEGLRTLVDRRILVEKASPNRPRFAFRHALMGDAYRARLLAPQRRTLHRIVGEAKERLLQLDGGITVGDLGYHFFAAGMWGKALLYANQASDEAWRVHATEEALSHSRRALEAALAIGDPVVDVLQRRCGQALGILGRFDDAREHFEAALARARQRGAQDYQLIILDDLAGLYTSRDYGVAATYAEEALHLARQASQDRDEAIALNRLGNILVNLRRFDEGREMHERAHRLFTASQYQPGQADSLDLIGMARYLAGDVPEARKAFGQAAALFANLGNIERVASSLTSRGLYLAVVDGHCATDASPRICHADAAEGLLISRKIGWRAGEIYALVALACADLGDGRYGDAQQRGEQALKLAEDIGHDQWRVIATFTLGILDTEVIDPASARQRFEQARHIAQLAAAGQWLERLDAWIFWCRMHAGDIDWSSYSRSPNDRPTSIGQRRALVAHIECQLAAGQPDLALDAMDRMLLGAAGPRSAGLLLLRGNILASLERLQEAEANYIDAQQIASDVGPRSIVWRTSAARSLFWSGRDEALSRNEALRAKSELLVLAGSIADEQRRAAFLRSSAVRPWVGTQPRISSAPTIGGLSPRERDVTVQVAHGLSNKEVARALGIAEKTVEMHVGNCLSKLQFVSRTQLAAWAVAEGIASAPKHRGSTG
jgi:DNA-binding CsgD family transcriptional regulator/predicted negative regulator of RcsB-dependent stress response